MKRLIFILVGLACAVGAAEKVSHELLVASANGGHIFRIDGEGQVAWKIPVKSARDAWLLNDGQVLYNDKTNVYIADKDGTVSWQYTGVTDSELHACQPLKNGNVLIAECGPCRIIEVNKAGKIVKEVPVPAKARTHMQMRGTRKTKSGTYVTAISGDQDVIEISNKGKVLRHYKPEGENYDHVHGITALNNGNVLIGTGKGGKFIEVDKNNKIVWEISAADLKGQAGFDDFKIAYAAGTQRLANGNTICAIHSGTVALVEVTPNKKIVWTRAQSKETKGAISVMVLDPSEKRKPIQK